MNQVDFFLHLSPDRVLEAVEAGGFLPSGHCMALNALENRVYDVRLEDGQHLVAKFYRPGRWNRDTILEEHLMLSALHDAEIPVCAPLRFSDGLTLHDVEGIYYAVWPRTGGRPPNELSLEEIQVLGRLLARIHNVGANLELKYRPTLNSLNYPLNSLALLESGDWIPASCQRRYRAAVEEVVSIYDERSQETEMLPIHGDCHAGNLLHGDEGWFFLDFDDMVIGPAVHDIWMLLPGRDLEAKQQREQLIAAYQEFRPFDERSLSLVEPLRAFRFIFYAAWIAKRWEDPAFPDAFAHFGSEEYWANETRDLEEQLEVILNGEKNHYDPSGNDSSQSNKSETTLTNKDFFWDL